MIVDFLATTGGFGCALSSVITILVRPTELMQCIIVDPALLPFQIFFPRDFQAEVDRDYERAQKKLASRASTTRRGTDPQSKSNPQAGSQNNRASYLITGSPVSVAAPLPDLEYGNGNMDTTPSPGGLHPLAEYDEDGDGDGEQSYMDHTIKTGWDAATATYEQESNYNKPLPPTSQRHSRLRLAAAGSPGAYSPSIISKTTSATNPWGKSRSQEEHVARDLEFPLTAHNLALHTSLERSRRGGHDGRQSRPSIYSFKSPIGM